MPFSSQKNWIDFLERIIGEVDAYISASGAHSYRVASWVRLIAERLGIHGEALEMIYLGALLHDIGKIGVPNEILIKEGPLNHREWEVMELHPTIGANIARATRSRDPVVSIIEAHQERYDGYGYPYGLGGDHIPLGARILAVVDAYDAMIDDRPYREARSSEAALAEIQQNRGFQFDPRVVDVFLEVIKDAPVS
jgi:putative nucleotidyltransferase with HDIG domain